MNIIVFIHTPADPLTAVYGHYARLAMQAAAAGHAVAVVAPQDFPSLARRHGRWLPLLYPFYVFVRLLRDAPTRDVVIFHSYAGWVANLMRWLPRLRHLRTVTAFHGLEPLYYGELSRQMALVGRPLRLPFRALHGGVLPRLLKASCRASDLVTCLNREELSYLVSHAWTTAARVRQLGHGIEPDFECPRVRDRDGNRLLFVGQWLEMKGVRYLVEAFDRLSQRDPDLELACIGTLAEAETVLGSFPSRVRGRVQVRPRVDRAELREWYARSDIFVFPTLSEGFSQALLEAMAAELAVVATSVGAAADVLEDDVNAIVVARRDVDALVAGVERLRADVALRTRLGRAARATAGRFDRHAELATTLDELTTLSPAAQTA